MNIQLNFIPVTPELSGLSPPELSFCLGFRSIPRLSRDDKMMINDAMLIKKNKKDCHAALKSRNILGPTHLLWSKHL